MMANVFVEPRPKGRREGSPIEDYVVEDHADHALATFKTQHEAIEWAKKNGHSPHVARPVSERGSDLPAPAFSKRLHLHVHLRTKRNVSSRRRQCTCNCKIDAIAYSGTDRVRSVATDEIRALSAQCCHVRGGFLASAAPAVTHLTAQ